MLHEPQFLSRDLCIGHKCAVVAGECLELAAERITLDPVDHETTVAGASCNAAIGINKVEVVPDILPTFDQVVVRVASC